MISDKKTELMDLRAERLELLSKLDSSSNPKRQTINGKLTKVTKKIKRLSGIADTYQGNGGWNRR